VGHSGGRAHSYSFGFIQYVVRLSQILNRRCKVNLDPLEVPFKEISPEALEGLIESFILREGTDYGFQEVSLEEKVSQVRVQLEKGLAKVYFDVDSKSFTLTLAEGREASVCRID